MANQRAESTRQTWLATLQKFRLDPDRAASADMWSPRLDAASRDELVAIQNEKLRAAVPFLYENSPFYRRRFARLGLLPSDIASVEDLKKWPVVDKREMMTDAAEHPPYGTYTTTTDEVWAKRGWMMFSSSGSTGAPRVFRYTHIDREAWAWANARALLAMGFRPGETVFMMSGYGPHVWAWGVQYALQKMELATIPGGGMDARARANIILRFKPTILLCTPSYALHLGRLMQSMGHDPAPTSVHTLFLAGEPALAVEPTRRRIENLWNARIVEFYGCTEASPHVGGYSCPALNRDTAIPATHLMEDVQIWETVDPETRQEEPPGRRGLTVCTNLNSESSPQLRFLVGDYATLTTERCLRPHSCARVGLVCRPRRRPDQSAGHQDVSDPGRRGGARFARKRRRVRDRHRHRRRRARHHDGALRALRSPKRRPGVAPPPRGRNPHALRGQSSGGNSRARYAAEDRVQGAAGEGSAEEINRGGQIPPRRVSATGVPPHGGSGYSAGCLGFGLTKVDFRLSHN